MKELNFLLEILRCPSCHNRLKKEEGNLLCLGCGQSFSIHHGVPILQDKESQLMLESGKEEVQLRKRGRLISFLRNTIDKFLPIFSNLLEHSWMFSKEDKERLPAFISKFGSSSLILDLGSGTKRQGNNVINLDIDTFENVDVVGDGHKLPFDDELFDAVISIAVLEHVNNPYRVASEIHRMLKKGGYVFIIVPFIWSFHSSTGTHQDFTRFTQFGLQELFSSFEKTEIGRAGPISMGVISILSEYLSLLITDRDILYWRLQKLFSWLLLPLRLLDPILSKKSKSYRSPRLLLYRQKMSLAKWALGTLGAQVLGVFCLTVWGMINAKERYLTLQKFACMYEKIIKFLMRW